MSDSRVSRRGFLTMLGVLIGAGAAGGLAWLSSDEDAAPSTTDGHSAAGSDPTTANATSAPATESTGTSAPTSTSSPTITEAPSTTEVTATTEPASTTIGEPPPTTSAAPSPTTSSSVPAGGGVEVICKEAWRASPVVGEFVGHQVERLTVHHTAVVMGSNTEAPRRMRSYQDYHQEQGWPDIAYHYLIDANGNVYEGRPVGGRGDTFTDYDPSGHFLVCCDGHFDRQGVPNAQLGALVEVLAWAAVEFAVDPSTIAGHRDYAGTTCPGSQLAALIADGTLRASVEERISEGGSALTSLCGVAGSERVAEIEAGFR